MRAHGAGPVECCKSIFAGQNDNIDSEMNARTQHRFNYRKQRECCFGHRCAKAARISEVAPPRRGHANMPPRTKSRSTQFPLRSDVLPSTALDGLKGSAASSLKAALSPKSA